MGGGRAGCGRGSRDVQVSGCGCRAAGGRLPTFSSAGLSGRRGMDFRTTPTSVCVAWVLMQDRFSFSVSGG